MQYKQIRNIYISTAYYVYCIYSVLIIDFGLSDVDLSDFVPENLKWQAENTLDLTGHPFFVILH